jgi:hypothetical protein
MISRGRAYLRYKKVLRLAQSPEPHEADAARRHAEAIASKYGFVSDTPEISFTPLKTRYKQFPEHINDLAITACDAFDCAYVLHDGACCIVGMDDCAKKARLMIIDLVALLRLDRNQYIAERSKKIPIRRKDRIDFLRRLRRDYERGWAMGAIIALQRMPWWPDVDAEIEDLDSIVIVDDEQPQEKIKSAYLSKGEREGEGYWRGYHYAIESSIKAISPYSPHKRIS